MFKSFFIETYGCQMNLYDSARIKAILASRGWAEAAAPEEADCVVLNSCAVRGHAEERVLGRVGELKGLKARKPGLILALAGCVAQERGSRLLEDFGQLDIVVGTESYDHLPELLQQALNGAPPAVNTSFCSCDHRRVTADFGCQATGFAAVIRGCDNFCSYCIVPYVRGRERSCSPQEIVAEVEAMAARGVRDITLVGQNVNSYRYGDVDFADLLAKVDAIDAIHRVRFITSHPKDCGEKLLRAMAGLPKVCPHLHLPLQSGDDRILQLMNRKYTVARYLEVAALARSLVPGLVLTSDVIVGFPGETEDEFRRTMTIVEGQRFDAAFTYKYSARPGTKAASLPDQLPEDVKLRRLDQLIKLQNRITLESNQADVGKTFEVMAEGPSKRGGTQMMGRTRGNKPAVFEGGGAVKPGDLVLVKILEATPGTLIGKIL